MEVFFINIDSYKQLVSQLEVKEPSLKHLLVSFIVGGTVGLLGTIVYQILLQNNIPAKESLLYVIGFLILSASLSTGLGFFDNWVSKARCGLIIPITGFAHSLTASALEYKKEGAITGIGANAFKLAGSVLVYGMSSAVLFAIVEVLLHG